MQQNFPIPRRLQGSASFRVVTTCFQGTAVESLSTRPVITGSPSTKPPYLILPEDSCILEGHVLLMPRYQQTCQFCCLSPLSTTIADNFLSHSDHPFLQTLRQDAFHAPYQSVWSPRLPLRHHSPLLHGFAPPTARSRSSNDGRFLRKDEECAGEDETGHGRWGERSGVGIG